MPVLFHGFTDVAGVQHYYNFFEIIFIGYTICNWTIKALYPIDEDATDSFESESLLIFRKKPRVTLSLLRITTFA